MALDANDLVESLMDEQARRNALFTDQPDQNAVVEDIVEVFPAESIGMQADTLSTTVTHTPHNWDDTPGSNTVWDFWSWDT